MSDRGSAPNVRSHGPFVRVMGPPGPDASFVVVLCGRLTVVGCHWSGRTYPCPGHGPCGFCGRGSPLLYYGFASAACNQWDCPSAVLRLSPHATDLAWAIQEQYGTLRGAVLQFWRRSAAPQARQKVSLARWMADGLLGPAYDPLPHLRRLWEVSDTFPFRLDWLDGDYTALPPDDARNALSDGAAAIRAECAARREGGAS